MTLPAAIVGASCVFPSGPSLPLADCALLTQTALIFRHPHYVDRCGQRVRASFFPEPEDSPFDVGRWCALAKRALDELALSLTVQGILHSRSGRRRCVLWLVLPPASRPGVPADLVERLQATVEDERFAWHRIDAVRGGHAVGVHAVKRAAAEVGAATDALAVVLSVDTWLHPDALQGLEASCLLHGAHARHEGQAKPNSYGRVPGEGAAAVAITRPDQAGTWAILLGTATASESITFANAEPCLGLGLTQAAHEATIQASKAGGTIDAITTDLNGEPYRADEFGFMTLRLTEALARDWKRTTPSQVSGDLGTASSITHLALAAYRLRRRSDAQPGNHLILCSSDDTLRGAMLLGPATLKGSPA